jgi:hypothetical protein
MLYPAWCMGLAYTFFLGLLFHSRDVSLIGLTGLLVRWFEEVLRG